MSTVRVRVRAPRRADGSIDQVQLDMLIAVVRKILERAREGEETHGR